ncbi:hypothetical protein A4A49_36122 [Nicotiana attenuata]|uniref:Uncharacterized protein n=2 Tax=Nicotiana attenuata TaxID=49451 RepID=A0A1J6K7A0_NICAT|nr:hypothetical protein A4A49_36122 [Nicotiana attenuata]
MTRPTLPRILVDPSSNLWKSRYDDTANRNMHNPDFGGPLGVMIFMRHGLVHEDVKQEKAKNPRTLDAVENDLYVFFPTYVPNFVRYMIELNLFRGCWMS